MKYLCLVLFCIAVGAVTSTVALWRTNREVERGRQTLTAMDRFEVRTDAEGAYLYDPERPDLRFVYRVLSVEEGLGDYEVWKDGELVSWVSHPWVYGTRIDYVGMPINLTGLAADGSPAMTVGYSDGEGGYTTEPPSQEAR